jgi:hypothetical protein
LARKSEGNTSGRDVDGGQRAKGAVATLVKGSNASEEAGNLNVIHSEPTSATVLLFDCKASRESLLAETLSLRTDEGQTHLEE